MARSTQSWSLEGPPKVARAMVRLGQIGFWVQLVFLIIVVILGGYVLTIVGGQSVGVANILSFLGIALPVFTTIWCRHYAGLGRSLLDSGAEPGPARVLNRVWIGVWAGAVGGALSLLSLFGAASTLLVTMLANPQVGIQVSAADTGASAYSISAVDAVSLMALLLTLTAELLVVAISLRLVFLTARASRDVMAE